MVRVRGRDKSTNIEDRRTRTRQSIDRGATGNIATIEEFFASREQPLTDKRNNPVILADDTVPTGRRAGRFRLSKSADARQKMNYSLPTSAAQPFKEFSGGSSWYKVGQFRSGDATAPALTLSGRIAFPPLIVGGSGTDTLRGGGELAPWVDYVAGEGVTNSGAMSKTPKIDPFNGMSVEDVRTLAYTILGEAEGEGPEGMLAVANVIRNRTQSPFFDDDPVDVALQPKQFSTWNKGRGGNQAQVQARNPEGSAAFNQAVVIVQRVFGSEDAPDLTGGALFYHAKNITPGWANGVTTSYGVTDIGGHRFYPQAPITTSATAAIDAMFGLPSVEAPSDLAVFTYTNQGAHRDKPVKNELETALQQSVTAVYGADYRFEIMSGEGDYGTRRHSTGTAADVWVYAPDGHRLTPKEMQPLAEHWLAADIGSAGLPVPGSNASLHLDLIGGSNPGSIPLKKGEGRYWFYDNEGTLSLGDLPGTLNTALTKKQRPDYAIDPAIVAAGLVPPASIPDVATEVDVTEDEFSISFVDGKFVMPGALQKVAPNPRPRPSWMDSNGVSPKEAIRQAKAETRLQQAFTVQDQPVEPPTYAPLVAGRPDAPVGRLPAAPITGGSGSDALPAGAGRDRLGTVPGNDKTIEDLRRETREQRIAVATRPKASDSPEVAAAKQTIRRGMEATNPNAAVTVAAAVGLPPAKASADQNIRDQRAEQKMPARVKKVVQQYPVPNRAELAPLMNPKPDPYASRGFKKGEIAPPADKFTRSNSSVAVPVVSAQITRTATTPPARTVEANAAKVVASNQQYGKVDEVPATTIRANDAGETILADYVEPKKLTATDRLRLRENTVTRSDEVDAMYAITSETLFTLRNGFDPTKLMPGPRLSKVEPIGEPVPVWQTGVVDATKSTTAVELAEGTGIDPKLAQQLDDAFDPTRPKKPVVETDFRRRQAAAEADAKPKPGQAQPISDLIDTMNTPGYRWIGGFNVDQGSRLLSGQPGRRIPFLMRLGLGLGSQKGNRMFDTGQNGWRVATSRDTDPVLAAQRQWLAGGGALTGEPAPLSIYGGANGFVGDAPSIDDRHLEFQRPTH